MYYTVRNAFKEFEKTGNMQRFAIDMVTIGDGFIKYGWQYTYITMCVRIMTDPRFAHLRNIKTVRDEAEEDYQLRQKFRGDKSW
jgi:hypothetical protein